MSYKEEISNRQQNHDAINRRKLTPESYGHGRTPGQRVIKGPAKRKRPDVGRPSNGTHRMTFRIRMALMGMHEIKTGFI